MSKLCKIMSIATLITLLTGCGAGTQSTEAPTESALPTPSATAPATAAPVTYSPLASAVLSQFENDGLSEYLVNEGNAYKIATLMEKAKSGGEYTICAFGGSISQGYGASNQECSYGYLVYKWWVESFPNASFKYVNAGLGGTNPEMALYRYNRDVKAYKPDFTVIDFAVNTFLDNNLSLTYSTLLNKLLSDGSAVMGIYFSRTVQASYKQGKYEPDLTIPEAPIADSLRNYSIPTINYHKYLWSKLDAKKAAWSDFGADWIHPNDAGHKLASMQICNFLEGIKGDTAAVIEKGEGKIPKLSNTKYENTDSLCNSSEGITLDGAFEKGDGLQSATRGWSIQGGSGTLKAVIPENAKKVCLLIHPISFSGSIDFVDNSGSVLQNVDTSNMISANLVTVNDLGDTVSLKINCEKGSVRVYYIGYTY